VALTELALRAGAAILGARRGDLATREKSDRSLVTAADEAAEAVILAGLAQIAPGIPVISEEQVAAGSAPAPGEIFFLVDPLDGTRDFVAGRDEFTVNIGLVAGGVPVLGVIAAPALELAWRGVRDRGAERVETAGGAASVRQIHTRGWPAGGAVALVSRSHLDVDTAALMARLGLTGQPSGSALKFCRLADGSADFYPRLAPTMEWDVAAGHALLAAAGGTVVMPDGRPQRYGRADAEFRIPAFLAYADPAAIPRTLP
jgi:3'(2'), 5'-bisphosphate nucleotidase